MKNVAIGTLPGSMIMLAVAFLFLLALKRELALLLVLLALLLGCVLGLVECEVAMTMESVVMMDCVAVVAVVVLRMRGLRMYVKCVFFAMLLAVFFRFLLALVWMLAVVVEPFFVLLLECERVLMECEAMMSMVAAVVMTVTMTMGCVAMMICVAMLVVVLPGADACGVCVVYLGVYGNCGVARSVDNAGCGCSVFVGSDVDASPVVGFVGCFVVGVYALC